jgi:hypothetical protein
MKNEPKTEVLLRMMEQPERYTEEQWNDILSDNECRELYTLMAMTRGAIDAAKADTELTDEEIEREWEKLIKVKNEGVNFRSSESNQASLNCRVVTKVSEAKSEKYTLPEESDSIHEGNSYFSFFTFHFSFKKIAAIFLAAAFLGGIAFAAYRVLSYRQTPPTDVSILNAQPSTLNSEADGLVLFADIRLDSMLTTVAAHYGKAVFFGNEDLKGLRIHTKWNPKDSLEAFMESLNELDGLKLTEQRDTIFVQKGGVQ